MRMYEVGGCVRDSLIGRPSKDIDFVVTLDQPVSWVGSDPFAYMVEELKEMGFKIFLETPQYLTVRAQFPDKSIRMHGDDSLNKFQFGNPHLTADFVLARSEGDYTDGRRPDAVIPGTLAQDLARRDFTMNAIARDLDGTLIDPFGGVADIEKKIIRAVDSPYERLQEDALRAVRALRFNVTLGFTLDVALMDAMQIKPVLDSLRENISDERIKDELSKMFRFNTLLSLEALRRFPALSRALFAGKVSLDATLKTKGKG